MDREVVPQNELVTIRDHLIKHGTYFLAGASSISVPSQKRKYLNERVCKSWPDGDGERVLMTPGEAARIELVREFSGLKRVGWSAPMFKLLDRRPPMLCVPGVTASHMVYVDLKSAYWQLYRLLWLDTCYPRGLYGKYPLYSVAERLYGWKAARNAVVGIARSTEIAGYKGHKRVTLRTTNKFLSPGLWATIQGLLHWIAGQAVEMGAVYVNTDGYLFMSHAQSDDFLEWSIDNGLTATIRAQGFGEVVGWNNYRVGKHATQIYKRSLPYYDKDFSNLRNEPGEKWERYKNRLDTISKGWRKNGITPRAEADNDQANTWNG